MAASIKDRMCPQVFRVLELYSGIGGMHYALNESGLSFEVVQAVDVNTNANKIYRFNFADTNITARGIEGLSVKDFDKFDMDMILMSPPCQPFTRVGKKQDTQDKRTSSFLHLLDQIPRLKKCPSYILIENVKGFEVSETRDKLIEMLEKCQYTYQEFLLTPLQFGIPNSRLRYYLIAKRSPLKFSFDRRSEIMEVLPSCTREWMKYKLLAESLQHQCVCGGFSSTELVQSVEEETSSSSDRLVPGENCCENITDMNQSNSNAQSESVSKKISGESGDSVISENKRTSDAGIEPDQSETHSCVKRLKIDYKNSTEGCSANKNSYSDEIKVTSTANKNSFNDKSSSVVDKNNCSDKSNSDRNNSSDKSSSIGNERFKSSPVGDRNKCTYKYSSVGDKSSSIGDKYNCRITTKCSDENAKMSVMHQNCLENYGLNMRQEQKQNDLGPCLSLSHFLERSGDSDHFKQFCVPEDMLKRFIVMDIINPCSRKSTCFTKRYAHFVNGAGSICQMTKDIELVEKAADMKEHVVHNQDKNEWSKEQLDVIRSLKLRYFTPTEIANILCFPSSFGFPSDLTNRQLYMLLGNSLNVHVVSVLIRLMVLGDYT